jgi:hypothetical protein
MGIYDEFPKEEKEVEPSPDQKMRNTQPNMKFLQILLMIWLPQNHPPTKGTHHTLESDEPLPSMFLSEIEVDVFEDFGNASNLLVQVKPRGPFTPLEDNDGPCNDSFVMEHIKGLSAILSREWLAEMELSTEVARITAPSETISCNLMGTTIWAYYSPTIGMNIISKAWAKALCPNESLIPSHKLLRTPSRVTLESYGVMRSIPIRIRGSKYR